MAWLDKNDITVPNVYGAVAPVLHWASPTKLVLVWLCRAGDLTGNIYSWPIDVDSATGTMSPDESAIQQIGTALHANESIAYLESLDGGGFALHTVSGGSS